MFLEAISGAVPLDGRDRVRKPPAPPKPLPREPELPPTSALTVEREDGMVTARGAGVSRAQVAELRSGRIRPEATLDLHGTTSADAEPALRRFLLESARLRRRCVLIVHGRGLHSDGAAVLRDLVRHALVGPMSGLVHSLSTAHVRDGGDGATYVMVRA